MNENFSEKIQKDFNEWKNKTNYFAGFNDKATRIFVEKLMEAAFFEGAKITLKRIEKGDV